MRIMSRALRAPLLILLVALGSGAAKAQDFTVNLKETDIQELIKFVAEATETTIVVSPFWKCTVTQRYAPAVWCG